MYAVANSNAAVAAARGESRQENGVQRDHSLEILSVLHQLVGLNKCAADIRAAPAVPVLT